MAGRSGVRGIRIAIIAVSAGGLLAVAALGLCGETMDTSVTDSDQNLVQNGAAALFLLSFGLLVLLAMTWMVPHMMREIRQAVRRRP